MRDSIYAIVRICSGRITGCSRGPGPLETPGLRGYKGASKRPPWNHPSNSIHDCNISISF